MFSMGQCLLISSLIFSGKGLLYVKVEGSMSARIGLEIFKNQYQRCQLC